MHRYWAARPAYHVHSKRLINDLIGNALPLLFWYLLKQGLPLCSKLGGGLAWFQLSEVCLEQNWIQAAGLAHISQTRGIRLKPTPVSALEREGTSSRCFHSANTGISCQFLNVSL